MNTTSIGWTDYSANPLKYRDADGKTRWACAKVSAGCTNCYSEALAKRWNRGADYNAAEVAKLTPFLDEKELHAMRTSKSISGKRVFVGDMTDVFGEWVPDLMIAWIWEVFSQRPDVTFQVLTKRAERMSKVWAKDVRPLPNVHLGVSCEDQQRADERIPFLTATPAAIRFISAEPLLGSIDLSENIGDLDWIIVGGESGPRFRSCEIAAITSIVDQCRRASVEVFVKQDAHRLPGQQGRIPSDYYVQQFPAASPRDGDRSGR